MPCPMCAIYRHQQPVSWAATTTRHDVQLAWLVTLALQLGPGPGPPLSHAHGTMVRSVTASQQVNDNQPCQSASLLQETWYGY